MIWSHLKVPLHKTEAHIFAWADTWWRPRQRVKPLLGHGTATASAAIMIAAEPLWSAIAVLLNV